MNVAFLGLESFVKSLSDKYILSTNYIPLREALGDSSGCISLPWAQEAP